MRKLIICTIVFFAAPLLGGCGFTPLYATNEGGAPQGLSAVHLDHIAASEEAADAVAHAFEGRMARPGANVEYDLALTVKEVAQPLAVQLDNSVTRYNYQLKGDYTLTRRADGRSIKGSVTSVASFNIVNSQYSTLFAEEAARDKAARVLAEEVERDMLVKLDIAREEGAAPPKAE